MRQLLLLVWWILMAMPWGQVLHAQTFSSPRGVQTEATLHATPAQVWELLIDFQHYPDWNPYIRSIEGIPQKGKRLHILIDGKEKDYDFKAKVLTLNPNGELAWGGSALFFFKARHYLRITPLANGQVKFTQGEAWGGLFGKSYGKKVYQEAAENFAKMNAKMADLLDGQPAVPK